MNVDLYEEDDQMDYAFDEERPDWEWSLFWETIKYKNEKVNFNQIICISEFP